MQAALAALRALAERRRHGARGCSTVATPAATAELPLLRSRADRRRRSCTAFTTRAGGVSAPPFDTLNLGGKWGDDAGSGRRKPEPPPARRGARGPLYVARQVHGARVVRVRARRRSGGDRARRGRRALHRRAGRRARACSSPTAFRRWSPIRAPALRRRARRLARHGGGRAAGGRARAGRRIRRAARGSAGGAGARPSAPAASRSAPRWRARSRRALGDARAPASCCRRRAARPASAHVDLKAANRLLLERAGVAPGAIDAGPECTQLRSRALLLVPARRRARPASMMGVVARCRRPAA